MLHDHDASTWWHYAAANDGQSHHFWIIVFDVVDRQAGLFMHACTQFR